MDMIELIENKRLEKYLIGKKIKYIDYLENEPITYNCLEIYFIDDSFLKIYSISRIIKDGKIILCSSDYYFNNEFIEVYSIKNIENTIIYEALKYANACAINKEIKEVKINSYGDLVLSLDMDLRVEAFFDTSEKEMDFYRFSDKDRNFFTVENCENGLEFFEGKINVG